MAGIMNIFRRLCPNTFVFANLSWREKLRHRAGQIDILKQIFLDNVLYIPIITFPNYYIVKAFINDKECQSFMGCADAASELTLITLSRTTCQVQLFGLLLTSSPFLCLHGHAFQQLYLAIVCGSEVFLGIEGRLIECLFWPADSHDRQQLLGF